MNGTDPKKYENFGDQQTPFCVRTPSPEDFLLKNEMFDLNKGNMLQHENIFFKKNKTNLVKKRRYNHLFCEKIIGINKQVEEISKNLFPLKDVKQKKIKDPKMNVSLKTNFDLVNNQINNFKRIKSQRISKHSLLKIKVQDLKKMKQKINQSDQILKFKTKKKTGFKMATRIDINESLKNLKVFLKKVFSFGTIRQNDLELLNDMERDLLVKIINVKQYLNKIELLKLIKNNEENQLVWSQFSKEKRKEENIKYGFKLIVKNLMRPLYQRLFKMTKSITPNNSNLQLYFYLFYFGHLEFNCTFEEIIKKVDFGTLKDEDVWEKLKKYVFPEVTPNIKNPTVRTINKQFLREISNSRDFVKELFEGSIDLLLFFSYCWKTPWKQLPKSEYCNMDQRGIKVMKNMGDINKNELNKLFSEWSNLIKKKSNGNVDTDPIKIIYDNIRRTNFKFPWSFKEVQKGMIYTFLTLIEHSFFNYLPKNSESKPYFFYNIRIDLP